MATMLLFCRINSVIYHQSFFIINFLGQYAIPGKGNTEQFLSNLNGLGLTDVNSMIRFLLFYLYYQNQKIFDMHTTLTRYLKTFKSSQADKRQNVRQNIEFHMRYSKFNAYFRPIIPVQQNPAMAQKLNEAELLDPRLVAFLQATNHPLKPLQQLSLYENIIAFLSDDLINDEEHHQRFTRILISIGNQSIFTALLSYILEYSRTKGLTIETGLFAFLLNYIDTSGKYHKHVINAFLSNSLTNSFYLQKLMDSCRSSQIRSELVFRRINQILVQKMNHPPVNHINFTPTSLFSLKCIQFCENVSNELIQEAIRHLLIVDSIQKGQIQKLIQQNEEILSKFELLSRRQFVSGYWYYLVAKIYSNQIQKGFDPQGNKIVAIAEDAYERIVSLIDTKSDLTEQIAKITYSLTDEKQKLNIICQLRGLAFFVSEYAKIKIKSNAVDKNMILIIEKMMQIKDFQCFEQLIQAYLQFINNKLVTSQFSPSIISSIQENCLPITSQTSLNQSIYDKWDLQFYMFSFQNKNEIRVQHSSSKAMDKIIEMMMDSRGCKHKQKICNCCQEYIHSTIEKQYDHQFNSHEFMSACHLMCRQISRVVSIHPEQSEVQSLKNYLLNNLKWLLNLNESCVPIHRKCINYKIFDLMITFPPLYENNQFLQQVIEDLIISRLPESFGHLNRLLKIYQQKRNSEKTMMISQNSRNNLQKLGQKIVKKVQDQSLKLEDAIKLWEIIITIWEKDDSKLLELMETSNNDNQALAKLIVLKKKKLRYSEQIQAKASEFQKKMTNYYHFCLEQLSFAQNYEKSNDC